jgi:hypothetical protein
MLVKNKKKKAPLGSPQHKWQDKIKMNHKDRGCEGMVGGHVVHMGEMKCIQHFGQKHE